MYFPLGNTNEFNIDLTDSVSDFTYVLRTSVKSIIYITSVIYIKLH